VDELESTYAALEQGLHRIDFFKARAPEAILRTIRTVISRASPDLQEAGILRAIGFEVSAYLDRMAEESAEPGPDQGPPGDG
jgi:tRNA C32,U32 (ribose-2'-O)-methylase TrmJ